MRSRKFDEWELPEIDDWDDDERKMRDEDRLIFIGGGFGCRPRFDCRPRFYGCRPRFFFDCRPRFFTCLPRPCFPI